MSLFHRIVIICISHNYSRTLICVHALLISRQNKASAFQSNVTFLCCINYSEFTNDNYYAYSVQMALYMHMTD